MDFSVPILVRYHKPMFFKRRPARIFLLALAVLLNVAVWPFVFFAPEPKLEVSFLNVGQGDAIFIEGPTGIQVLIDGGRDRSVLRELGRRMGPLDRSLDLVIATHPDADHIGGLAPVFKAYDVNAFMSPGIPNITTPTQALEDAVAHEIILRTTIARRGMHIPLGGRAYAEVLFPDRNVEHLETNTGSIVLRVVYGETSFFLSGDSPEAVEDWLVRLDGELLESDVVKAGHHGSRTSTGEALLASADPEVVIISAGKDNQYGHPHQEVLDRVTESGAKILSTAEEGTITFISDGAHIRER
jgi:competence protein ComEC